MAGLITKLETTLRPAYVRWPLLLVFLLALPWLILVIPIYQANNFTYSQLNLWLTFSVVALGLNLLTGLTGMISLGHSAIYAIGAYVAGYFMVKVPELPYPLAIVLTAIFAGFIGLILGLPALRLSGPYLAVATFGFAIGVPQMLTSSKELGALFADPEDITTKIGVVKVPRQVLPGFEVRNDLGRYYLFLIIVLVMIVLAIGLWRSRTGRAFRAIRDSETAAQAMGINLPRYKVLAFVLSAMYAGVGGAMYSAQVGQLEAADTQFSAVESVLFLAAIILGGLGSIPGAFLGAAVLTILPTATNALKGVIRDSFGLTIENFESIFYGLIIILCVFYMPTGLVGAWKSLTNRWRNPAKTGAEARLTPEQEAARENSLPIPDEMVREAGKGV